MSTAGTLQVLPSLSQLVGLFGQRRVLVVGDLVADQYVYGQTDRISREAPVLVVRYDSSEVKPGGGANAAANVRALGGQVTCIGVLGADAMGKSLQEGLRDEGIRLVTASGAGIATETKTRILAGGQNTTRQQMLRVDRSRREPLPPRVSARIRRAVEEAASGCDAVLVSDYGSGVVDEPLRALLRRLTADGMPVCADSRYGLGRLQGLTVCKPNEPELEALVGHALATEEELLVAAAQTLRTLECRALVVTRGRSGMIVLEAGGGAELLPVHGAGDAVDVTGAGDTVSAALALGLAVGATIGQAARLANIAAGLVVQKPGTATISGGELLSALDPVGGRVGLRL